MPYKYQIKKGHEARVFANARNLGNGIVESDEPLNSPYLTLVKDGEEMTAQKPAEATASTPAANAGMPVNTPPAPEKPVSQNVTPPLKEEAKS